MVSNAFPVHNVLLVIIEQCYRQLSYTMHLFVVPFMLRRSRSLGAYVSRNYYET